MSFSFKAGILNLVEGSGGKNILKADVTKGMNEENIIWSPISSCKESLSYPSKGEFVLLKGCQDGTVFNLKGSKLFLWLQDPLCSGEEVCKMVNSIIGDKVSIQDICSIAKFREFKDSFDYNSLYSLLPEGSPHSIDELENVINSIPFKQCLEFIDSYLPEGDLAPLLSQLGISDPFLVRDFPSLMRAFKKKK